ncbi:MAG: hypothetical protein HYS44_03105 [Candidatus Niyogibacteria bacterium]|nr:hypothetical protein [Candidatus Niyogibacteria bacterium]
MNKNPVSLPQSHQLMAALATNMGWSYLSSELLQRVIEKPRELGIEFTRFLLNEARFSVVVTDGIKPPKGGRVEILTVVVDESKPWEDAIRAAAPETTPDYSIWKQADRYPAYKDSIRKLMRVVLVNFGSGTHISDALKWGKNKSLHPVSPRTIFAIGKHYPMLYEFFGMDQVAIITGSVETGRCIDVWIERSRRAAHDGTLKEGERPWYDFYWFAFTREF